MTAIAPAQNVRTFTRRSTAEQLPMRYPNRASTQVMNRRGWWLVILGWLIPGSAQVLSGSRRLGRFAISATIFSWLLVIVGTLAFLLWRDGLARLLINPIAFMALAGIAVAYGLLWVIVGIDTLRLVRLVDTGGCSRYGIAILAVVFLVVSGGSVAYAAPRLVSASTALGSIFGESAPPVEPSDGYYNILLLGADAGDGRDSVRFDSMTVVSINAETGAAVLTGIPRELGNAPFAEGSPMAELYSNGFEGRSDFSCGWDDWMNHIRQAAEICREDNGDGLYPNARAEGSEPGIEATKDAAAGLLGIDIPYYVFIDMQGFASLIDALGGVEITVDERLPEGGGPAYDGQPADEWAIGWIEPGTQVMDGDTAQWYARSRYTTNDFDRMERQRELQTAILAQFTPQNIIDNFQSVAAAGIDLVSTDIPQSMLPTFLDLATLTREAGTTSIELTPESDLAVDQDDPDVAMIQEALRDIMHPPSEDDAANDGAAP